MIVPCVLAVALGGWMWLRGSSLVAVQKVTVSGVRGPGASDIRATLVRTAMGMSTMHVDRGRLLAAVAPYRVVRDLRLSPAFPHGLHITVVEDPVVALLAGGGAEPQPVTLSGAIVPGAPMPSSLPVIKLPAPLVGLRVRNRSVLTQLAVLGAAPSGLRVRVSRVFRGPEGLELSLRGGPILWFGNASRPHAKWLAAERILADAGDQGISYIDLRIPDRPAARIVNSSGALLPGGLTGTTTSPTDALNQALQTTATRGATIGGGRSSSGVAVAVGSGSPSGSAYSGGGGGAGAAGTGTSAGGTGTATPAGGSGAGPSAGTGSSSGPAAGAGTPSAAGGTGASGGAGAGAGSGASPSGAAVPAVPPPSSGTAAGAAAAP
jgi:cell division protein FtsQ